ncbi:hypothetical protein [Streptomyces uncialis]|nr:hypothetical protein [Streptomyces uncialis]
MGFWNTVAQATGENDDARRAALIAQAEAELKAAEEAEKAKTQTEQK